MKLFLSLIPLMMVAGAAWADSASDLVHTAKAVKTIIEKGNKIPTVISVEMVEQMSLPPKSCAMVIYERRPNSECPNEYGQGIRCLFFNPASEEVGYVGGANSLCPPKP